MMDFDHDEIFENFEDEFLKRKRKKRQGTAIPPWMFILFILIIIFAILLIRRNPKPQEILSETTQPSFVFTETFVIPDHTSSPQAEAESVTMLDSNLLAPSSTAVAVESADISTLQNKEESILQVTKISEIIPIVATEGHSPILTIIPESTQTTPVKVTGIPQNQSDFPKMMTETESSESIIPIVPSAAQPAAIQIATDQKVEIQPSATVQAAAKFTVSDQPRTPIVIQKTSTTIGQEATSAPVAPSIVFSPVTNSVTDDSNSSQTVPSVVKIVPTKPLSTRTNAVIVTVNVSMEKEISETAIPAEATQNDPVAVNAVSAVPEVIGTETQVLPDSTEAVASNSDTTHENENWFRKFINFWKRLFGIKPSVSSVATFTATVEENPTMAVPPVVTEATTAIIQAHTTEIPMDREMITPEISELVHIESSPTNNFPATMIPAETLSVSETDIAEPKIVTEPKQEEDLSLIQKLLDSIQRLFHKEPESIPTISVIEELAKQESENRTADLQTVSTPPISESQTENEATKTVAAVIDEPARDLPNAISGPARTSEVPIDGKLFVSNPSSMKDVEITATYSDLDDEPLKFEDVDYSNEPTRTPISENTSEPLPTEITPAVTKIDLVRIITLPVTKLTPVRQTTVTISSRDSGATKVPVIRETILPETGFADRLNLPMVIFVIMVLLVLILSVRVMRTKNRMK
ncbi:hypothetical protein [Flexilinea flocculi]|uniref:Uncharacterized protein n=1 Tax=Flexilinea flocculi TaxID=1678840 RepID=A0A0K8P9N1_9CHLR|nr:hypothetical protein [Flexilinea flocculi]GAP39368.1 hypothetical protein ATC1_11298 [Flexilinea flocculi]